MSYPGGGHCNVLAGADVSRGCPQADRYMYTAVHRWRHIDGQKIRIRKTIIWMDVLRQIQA